jgi:hypothetical protein
MTIMKLTAKMPKTVIAFTDRPLVSDAPRRAGGRNVADNQQLVGKAA